MNGLKHSLVAAALALIPLAPALAEEYWASSYQDFDVVAVGGHGGARAIRLAHDVARFENALTQILRVPQRHLPTHIYELPPKVLKGLIGSAGSSYQFNGYEVTVVTDSGRTRDDDWGALFGYTGSFLFSEGFARYPYWFQTGVPELFATTEFDMERVRTGGLNGYSRTLTSSRLIPMRVFLRIRSGDPQLASPTVSAMFSAESWYLARDILVEGRLRSEFGKYLSLIQGGTSEEEAFSQSFKLSYEALDKQLLHDMLEQTHIFEVKVPRELLENPVARPLSSAEVDARLAHLSFQWSHHEDALHLASHALEQDAANELALRTLAREKAREGDFSGALSAVDKLGGLPSLSAAALTDSGEVLARLASEVASSHASLGTDTASLRARAQAAFERAVSLDPEYLRAWTGLANLYAQPAAAADARALLPRVQPVMEKHPYSGRLARALTLMCVRTGQMSSAFLFVEFWRSDAITDRDRDQATALLASMQTH